MYSFLLANNKAPFQLVRLPLTWDMNIFREPDVKLRESRGWCDDEFRLVTSEPANVEYRKQSRRA